MRQAAQKQTSGQAEPLHNLDRTVTANLSNPDEAVHTLGLGTGFAESIPTEEQTVMHETEPRMNLNRRHGTAPRGLMRELGLVMRQARKVWRLVPRRHKLAFGGVLLVMAVTSACSTAVPLLLGSLVDRVQHGTEQGLG